MKSCTIENRFLSLSVDDKGRIVSLVNKLTNTELGAFVINCWYSKQLSYAKSILTNSNNKS